VYSAHSLPVLQICRRLKKLLELVSVGSTSLECVVAQKPPLSVISSFSSAQMLFFRIYTIYRRHNTRTLIPMNTCTQTLPLEASSCRQILKIDEVTTGVSLSTGTMAITKC
jgi:hypothetical protein